MADVLESLGRILAAYVEEDFLTASVWELAFWPSLYNLLLIVTGVFWDGRLYY